VLLLTVLVLAHRTATALRHDVSTGRATVSQEDAWRGSSRIVREAERQIGELVALGVENAAADLGSLADWPDAAWWAGYRIPQLAFLTRRVKELPDGMDAISELSESVRDNLSRLSLAAQTTAEIDAQV